MPLRHDWACQSCLDDRSLYSRNFPPIAAKVSVLATRRQLCAFHALKDAKLHILAVFWERRDLIATLRRVGGWDEETHRV